MLLIECPWCGERDQTEFSCHGEAHITRPRDPDALTQVHHLTADESNPKLDAPQPVVLLGNGSAYVRPDARTVDEMLRLIWDASA